MFRNRTLFDQLIHKAMVKTFALYRGGMRPEAAFKAALESFLLDALLLLGTTSKDPSGNPPTQPPTEITSDGKVIHYPDWQPKKDFPGEQHHVSTVN